MTDELIARLSADAAPVPRHTVPLWLIGGAAIAAVISILLLIFWLGLRWDYPRAFGNPVFWTKLFYPLLLGLGGFWAAERLSRPGVRGRTAFIAALGLFLLSAALGMMQMRMAPPEQMRTLVMGSTALVCPFYIVTLSLPMLAVTLLVMRRLAPTNLPLAGLAAGLFTGGLGAAIYSLHCSENGLPFLAIWYTLGIVLTAAIGAIAGRWALRW